MSHNAENRDADLRANAGRSALFTDLYELTMAQAYLAEGMQETAVFELAFRTLPATRNYVMACGLARVLSWLEALRFTAADLAYLDGLQRLSGAFLRRLEDLSFSGDVYAVPEGTVVFPNEPVIQVIAPIIEAQPAETWILNQVHCASVFASKAARVVTAAQGCAVVHFGARRAHGFDAALQVARASYIAGATATSNVEAGRCYGIPADGTMAHSYIQAHDDEREAVSRFVREFPGTTVLVDTYDTISAVRKLIGLLLDSGGELTIGAVRLDSGDIDSLSRETRRLLDEAGLRQVKIIASSGLDEHKIAALVRVSAPVDGFGVGTRLAVSSDAPELDFAYKLVEYAGRPRMKTSSDKLVLPGRKQVFRRWRDDQMASTNSTRASRCWSR